MFWRTDNDETSIKFCTYDGNNKIINFYLHRYNKQLMETHAILLEITISGYFIISRITKHQQGAFK